MPEKREHVPVLEKEVLEQFTYLSKLERGYFFDGTLGAGGHSIAIARMSDENIKFIGTDLDQDALKLAKKNIKKAGFSDRFILEWGNFKDAKETLDRLEVKSVVGVLIDLGVSSMQFDRPERGFSFKYPLEPLDMRMNQNQELDAKYVLNSYNEDTLEAIFREYGEERFARRIANTITQIRKNKRIETIGDLLEILQLAVPKKFQRGRIHFATKVFQALRIEVNAELTKLDQAVYDIIERMVPGGRLAIITFHSLEDRIIKKTFLKLQTPCECPPEMPCICGKKPIAKIITRKPVAPTLEEISLNPRSRSAKLRVVEKL